MLDELKRQGWPLSLLLAGIVGGGVGLASARPFAPLSGEDRPSSGSLPSFASEAQLRDFFRQRQAAMEAQRRRVPFSNDAVMLEMAPAEVAAPSESITNTQEAGVDEGGIVKATGDYLVVLRRGRLFTVSTADAGLRAIDVIDVPPPGSAPRGGWGGAWYDEMLVVGDHVVVIGYSYEKAGTEIVRFRLSPDGRLAFEDVSRLSASDYYSAENYASRLIGNELVLYNVRGLDLEDDPMAMLPALTDETPGRAPARRPLARPEDVFLDPQARPSNLAYSALHSVTRCDLTAPRLDCEATAVLGPWSRTFYVSPNAIYLWTTAMTERAAPGAAATVYRMPLDGGRPQAVRVSGAPLDQFSFREDRGRGRLDVVVQSDEGGDAMWDRESRTGAARLLSLPLRRFGNGSGAARASDYRALPEAASEGWNRHNRFVGGHLLYAVGREDAEGNTQGGALFIGDVDGGPFRTLDLDQPVSRIEAMGGDALIVTGDEHGMVLQAVELDGAVRLGARFSLTGAGETETRSHGFFFRPDARGGSIGVLALPFRRNPPSDSRHTAWAGGAEMLFLRREASSLGDLGVLSSGRTRGDDRCRVSCVDWYGQARPIFLRGRVFALMGYELVEGRLEDGRIREIGRLDFTPRPRSA